MKNLEERLQRRERDKTKGLSCKGISRLALRGKQRLCILFVPQEGILTSLKVISPPLENAWSKFSRMKRKHNLYSSLHVADYMYFAWFHCIFHNFFSHEPLGERLHIFFKDLLKFHLVNMRSTYNLILVSCIQFSDSTLTYMTLGLIYFSERSPAAGGEGAEEDSEGLLHSLNKRCWHLRVGRWKQRSQKGDTFRVSFEGELVRPAEELDVGWEGRRGNKDDIYSFFFPF